MLLVKWLRFILKWVYGKKVITEPKILVAIFVTLLLFDFALSYNNPNKNSKNVIKKKDISICYDLTFHYILSRKSFFFEQRFLGQLKLDLL